MLQNQCEVLGVPRQQNTLLSALQCSPLAPCSQGIQATAGGEPSFEAMPRERGEREGAVGGGCLVTVSHAAHFTRKQIPLC